MSEINIVTEPSVYLIGRQSVDYEGLGSFLAHHDVAGWESSTAVPGQVLVETAGRLCYMSFANPRPGGNAAYLRHILEVGHGSVLEHAVFTLILTGISRSCSHELVRHRVGLSPSQLSQRYVDESDVAFVVPPALWRSWDLADPDDDEVTGQWDRWVAGRKADLAEYRRLVEDIFDLDRPPDDGYGNGSTVVERRKAAREAARSVLPNCTETKIQLTGNARAWRHLFDLRASPGADAEIRRLALAIHRVLSEAAPNLFGDYESTHTDDGVEYLTTPHPGV